MYSSKRFNLILVLLMVERNGYKMTFMTSSDSMNICNCRLDMLRIVQTSHDLESFTKIFRKIRKVRAVRNDFETVGNIKKDSNSKNSELFREFCKVSKRLGKF